MRSMAAAMSCPCVFVTSRMGNLLERLFHRAGAALRFATEAREQPGCGWSRSAISMSEGSTMN